MSMSFSRGSSVSTESKRCASSPLAAVTVYWRTGLLAHTYMLGPNGDSNGCVSFKNYNAFLQAYQNGEVKRLVVVARLN
jgi:Protein of unknown function (DUF2778)